VARPGFESESRQSAAVFLFGPSETLLKASEGGDSYLRFFASVSDFYCTFWF
jgi:hypothetical protein